jgi:hypothetical protein
MATNERPSAEEIRSAVSQAGLDLSDDDLRQLADGQDVDLTEQHAAAATRGGRCEGIRIFKINERCGIYLQLNPPRIQVCCDFPGI